jgi:hypothetical protein
MKLKLTHPFSRFGTLGVLSALIVATSAFGGPVPGNLGSGLDLLVRERLALQEAKGGAIDPALTEQAQSQRDLAITHKDGRVKVYVHLAPRAERSAKAAAKFDPEAVLPDSAEVTAMDMTYRGGIIETWIDVDDVPALARDKRVLTVILAIKPILDVGATTAQGFVQHRVNLTNRNGAGITVGVMSDSYDTNPTAITRASTDVTTGDLPGPTNPNGNTQPVVVLDDPLQASDEGRGMAQIVHDMAPAARLGFATASAGEVSFADNIRSLAGIPGASHTQPGFAAQVIVDDLFYSNSPMFGTSLIGRAVNEVAALGVSYFSSAGNRSSQQGYFKDANIVSPAAGQAANPTLNFTNVPAALYAGGFHNFRTDGGTDISQTIVGGGSISFQWDDPFDVTPPSFTPAPFFSGGGTVSATTPQVDVVVPGLTAGAQYRVNVQGTPNPDAFDAVVDVFDPNGNLVVHQDTGFPEEVFFFAPVSGNHTVRVTGFQGATGEFTVTAHNASGTQRITVDYNLLFFSNTTGAFISASTIGSNNFASNQPLELAALPAGTTQMVIARANTPTAPVPATKIRYVMTTGRALEYFDYQTPITFGHNHEPGALSTAGVGPFPPFLPEDYSSPGPSYIYFDQNANRLATPIIRQKPDIAAATNVNTTFFGGPQADSTRDADTFPNFGGTSAAAPSAAGIAALVLQANGGPGSVTQPQMRTILQRAGFNHDLDPFFAVGQARTSNGGKLAITVRANQNGFSNTDGTSVSTSDTNVVAVSYVGPGSVSSLSFDMRGGSPTSGNEVTNMQTPGLVWDTGAPTTGFPFTLGRITGGLTPAAITAAFTDPAPPPANATPPQRHFFTLNLTFTAGSFTGGSGFTFGCDRDEFSGANNPPATNIGNSADHWGKIVRHPQGDTPMPNDQSGQPANGVRFSGTMSDGSTFSGVIMNRIGKGYSFLDGYGFINAEDAVAQPLP